MFGEGVAVNSRVGRNQRDEPAPCCRVASKELLAVFFLFLGSEVSERVAHGDNRRQYRLCYIYIYFLPALSGGLLVKVFQSLMTVLFHVWMLQL